MEGITLNHDLRRTSDHSATSETLPSILLYWKRTSLGSPQHLGFTTLIVFLNSGRILRSIDLLKPVSDEGLASRIQPVHRKQHAIADFPKAGVNFK
jgi:hypothetical protein